RKFKISIENVILETKIYPKKQVVKLVQKNWLTSIVAAILLFSFVLVACGSDSASSSNGSGGSTSSTSSPSSATGSDMERVSIKVGIVPAAINFPLLAGIKEGLYEANGIDIELFPFADYGALYTSIQANEIDIAYGAGPA